MRGSGKSLMSKALGHELNKKVIDLDEEFSKEFSMTIKDFVQANGWPQFRVKEEELFKKVVASNKVKKIHRKFFLIYIRDI